MRVPSCDSEVRIKIAVSVLSLDISSYTFPDNCELVSAVYDVSANKPFPLPVTVKLQHCVALKQNKAVKMSFVTADITQGYPYKFHKESGGVFSSKYGEISLNHFTIIATIMWWLYYPEEFCGYVYCEDDEVIFVVTKDIPAHIEVCCIVLHNITVLLKV